MVNNPDSTFEATLACTGEDVPASAIFLAERERIVKAEADLRQQLKARHAHASSETDLLVQSGESLLLTVHSLLVKAVEVDNEILRIRKRKALGES